MSASYLLKLLDSAPAQSLDSLALVLGVDPVLAGDWLAQLSEQGFAIQTDDRGALSLLRSVDWLQAQRIASRSASVEILLSTTSTSDELLERAQTGSIHGQAVFAEHQTAGRGRLGRQWVSPVARNIYLSLGWQFSQGAAALQGLSLAIGAAIADALDRQLGIALALKWPNDLFFNGAKCGGILVDLTGDIAHQCTAVVGVGLNVQMHANPAQGIDQAWTSIDAARAAPFERNVVAKILLTAITDCLVDFPSVTFGGWRVRWQQRDLLRGRYVTVGSERGIAVGVDGAGALLLDDDGIHRSVSSGDATLRSQSEVN